jgi:hypothetical protein
MNQNRSDNHQTTDPEAKRRPHSIRFLDPEWERIEAFADERGLTGPEFVRFATLAAIDNGRESLAGLAPLIKTTFRASHILATRLRQEMLDADEQEDLDALIADARSLQEQLMDRAWD